MKKLLTSLLNPFVFIYALNMFGRGYRVGGLFFAGLLANVETIIIVVFSLKFNMQLDNLFSALVITNFIAGAVFYWLVTSKLLEKHEIELREKIEKLKTSWFRIIGLYTYGIFWVLLMGFYLFFSHLILGVQLKY